LVFLVLGLLGMVYSYVRDRYGLAASIACHVTVGFLVQVLPSLLYSMRVIT